MTKEKYWFKAKKYGWGWYPCTWQGWLILGVFVLYISQRSFAINTLIGIGRPDPLRFFFEILIPTVILLLLCYWKGEKPRWRWGK
jgi:hypothetical protein